MNEPYDHLAVLNAEREISAILARVEKATGCLIESVQVIDHDVTGFADDRQQLQRRFVIGLRPLPGTRWA